MKPYVWLVAGVVGAFLIGSFLIDAALPGGLRQAMLLTLPSDTGSVIRDYALTVYQAIVLTAGVVLGIRMARRRASFRG